MATSCARRKHLAVVRRNSFRQPCLDTDDMVAIARDGRLGGVDVGQRKIVRATLGQDALAANVDQDTRRLGRRPRDRHHIANLVRACRPRIHPSRHAVRQADARAVVVLRVVAMDIEEPRHDELARRIDHLGGGNVDVRGDRRDTAPGHRDVPERVDVK